MKKISGILVVLVFLISLATPALAVDRPALFRSEFSLDPDEEIAQLPITSAIVNIRNIASGDSVYSTVVIIAKVTGVFSSVVYQIDGGPQYRMNRVGTTNRYQASWDTTTVSAGTHTLYVKAKNRMGSVVGSASVSITVVTSYKWEANYEIDYVAGHIPSQSVLDYWQYYWRGHAIDVTFLVDDAVSDPTPDDGYISRSDFWSIESAYNDVWKYDDRSNGGANPKYFLKEKWMLYGTWDTNPNVGGYTYVSVSGSNLQAGNYIFIADSMIDDWEAQNSIPNDGGEVIVTMHEAGHSIGIAKLLLGLERYDSDSYSIMSTMRIENAKYMTGYWYYSKEYWATANKNYYTI